MEWKLTFTSPVATAEFSKFADILSAAPSQHHLLEFEIPQPGSSLVAKSYLTLVTPLTVACQAPLSMGFPRQHYWSGLPFPSPGDCPNPGIEPEFLHCRHILYHWANWETHTKTTQHINNQKDLRLTFEKLVDNNIKKTEMLEVPDKDFKATVIKMQLAIINMLETNEKLESLSKDTESLSKEIGDTKKNHM